MKYRGDTNVILKPAKDDLVFQILDWQGEDEPKTLQAGDPWPVNWKAIQQKKEEEEEEDGTDNEEDDEEMEEQKELERELLERQRGEREYKIRMFGVTAKGHSVCVHVTNFKPFFYIKPIGEWTDKHTTVFKKFLPSFLREFPTKFGKKNFSRSLIGLDLEMRKDFVGFRNELKEPFFKLSFSNLAALKAISRFFDENKNFEIPGLQNAITFEVFEANIVPFIRLIHQQDLNPAGWVKLSAGDYTVPRIKSQKWSRCQIEATIDATKLQKVESADIAPLLIASFDLECTSEDGSFPNPNRKGDAVIQIGMTVFQYPEKTPLIQYIGTLGKCAPIEGVIVESCATEKELLRKWLQFIYKIDPDVFTGYNIWDFDWRYLRERSKFLGMGDEFVDFGRLRGRPSQWTEQKLASSALGENFLKYYDLTGRIQIDMYKLIQKDYKLDMYKLDFVASHFMGLNKVDLSPKELFQRFRSGTPEDLKEIAVYCVQDCALCNHLMNKLEVVANNLGMANVCYVPFSWLFMKGQGVKIFSLVSRQCRNEGFCMPWIRKNVYWRRRGYPALSEASSYEGAIVLTANPGIYMEPITVMDYGSLYPSSMISENISHDSIVYFQIYDNDNKLTYEWGNRKYDNLPGYKYNEIEFENKTSEDILAAFDGELSDSDEELPTARKQSSKVVNGRTVCRYAEKESGEKNVIPRILQGLLKARKTTRKKAELEVITTDDGVYEGWVAENGDELVITTEEGAKHKVHANSVKKREDKFNSFQKKVLDGLQLAYKVTANSLYGQVGAVTSPICMKELAASTTATGRKQLMIAQTFVETEYPGTRVIYGDSVSGDTPLLLRNPETGEVSIQTIENLSDTWIPYREFKPWDSNLKEKQQASVEWEVWTNNKWAKINRVIRHKTIKKIYRVNTHTGCVDVSEDHSLLDEQGNQIKPIECAVGKTKLLHSFPEIEEKVSEVRRYVPEYGNYEPVEQLKCSKCDNEYDSTDFYKSCVYKSGQVYRETCIDKRDIYVPSRELTEEEAWVWGLFMAEGSCKSGNKHSWAINLSDKEKLEKAKNILNKVEPISFKILDTMKSSHVYKLVPQKHIYYMVTRYRALFYDEKSNKIVPNIILNSKKEVRKSFFEGYYLGEYGINKNIDFVCKGKTGTQGLYYIAKSIGFTNLKVLNDSRRNKSDIYRIQSTPKFRKNPNVLKKIIELGECEQAFIYDLETSEGIFHAGIGEMVVKNTDSIFCNFMPYLNEKYGRELKGEEALQVSIDLGIEAADRITNERLKRPQTLNYEKVLWPFIQLAKKRYVGHLYETNVKKYHRKEMGIVLKRRDNAFIVKKIYGGMIDHILKHQDLPSAIEYFQEQMKNLLDGNVDIKDLIITKTLKATYADRTKIAHAMLADRMGERDPGNKPASNDRIPFVFVETPPVAKGQKILQGDKVEHPEYVRSHPEIRPDYRQYWDCQVKTPCLQLLALALRDLPGYQNGWIERVEQMVKEKGLSEEKYEKKMEALRQQEAERLLCTGAIAEDDAKREIRWDGIMKKKRAAKTTGQLSMMRFVKESPDTKTQLEKENAARRRLENLKIRNETDKNKKLTVKGVDTSKASGTITDFWANLGKSK